MAAKTFSLVAPDLGSGCPVDIRTAPAVLKSLVWSGATSAGRWARVEGSVDGLAPWGTLAVLGGPSGTLNFSTELDYVRLVRLAPVGGTVELTGSDDVPQGQDGISSVTREAGAPAFDTETFVGTFTGTFDPPLDKTGFAPGMPVVAMDAENPVGVAGTVVSVTEDTLVIQATGSVPDGEELDPSSILSWIISAAGPKGEKGDQGDAGTQGPQGNAGAKGDKGDQGDPGAAGADGADGADGAQGPAGPLNPVPISQGSGVINAESGRPRVLCFTDGAGAVTVNLPDRVAGPPDDLYSEWEVIDVVGNALVNNITITVPAGQYMNGVQDATKVISLNFGRVRIIRWDASHFTASNVV